MNQISLPKDVIFIIEELNKAGYEAYAVGGCIRDILLGRKPGDWDITTSAFPKEVKKIFKKTIDTGLQHGTVTVMLHRVGYEVTTYRIDGEYEDHRHPKNVVFTANLIEDLKRRDFTINAMAYNQETGIVDEFDGIKDLKQKRIRCVGNPKERFSEDALRMLRAVRFSAQLGFTIEEATEKAAYELSPMLEKISKERIQAELNKLLTSAHPEYIKKIYQIGLSRYVLPQTEKFQDEKIQSKIIKLLKSLPSDSILRWAGFLSFCNEEEQFGETILRNLKFDNHTIEFVSKLVKYFPMEAEPDEIKIRFALHEMGEELYPLYLTLKKAELPSEKTLEKTEELYQRIVEREDCISLKTLQVTGKDLIKEGFLPGKELGRILNKLLLLVIENPKENNKERLLELAKRISKNEK